MGRKFCGDGFGGIPFVLLLLLFVFVLLLLLLLVLFPLCNNWIQARYNVHFVLAPRKGCNKLNNPMGGASDDDDDTDEVSVVVDTEDVMASVVAVAVVFPVDILPESVGTASCCCCCCCCCAKNAMISAILSTFNNVTSFCIIQE